MAKRFAFALAPLLRLREQTEENRKKEFAAANRAVREEREHRARMAAEREAMQAEIVRMYAEKAPFAHITECYREVGRYGGEIMRSEIREDGLLKAVEAARERLIEAQRDRQAMETLRDNQRAEFDREMERLEQATLDELAIRARARYLAENAEPESP